MKEVEKVALINIVKESKNFEEAIEKINQVKPNLTQEIFCPQKSFLKSIEETLINFINDHILWLELKVNFVALYEGNDYSERYENDKRYISKAFYSGSLEQDTLISILERKEDLKDKLKNFFENFHEYTKLYILESLEEDFEFAREKEVKKFTLYKYNTAIPFTIHYGKSNFIEPLHTLKKITKIIEIYEREKIFVFVPIFSFLFSFASNMFLFFFIEKISDFYGPKEVIEITQISTIRKFYGILLEGKIKETF